MTLPRALFEGVWRDSTPYARFNGVTYPAQSMWRRENGVWVLRWRNEIVVVLGASNPDRFDLMFSEEDWASDITKRIINPEGNEVGNTAYSYVFATSASAGGQAGSFGGQLIFDNYGTISGRSGAANGGTGGDVFNANFLGRDGQKLIINNYDTVRSGGGGGGKGGTGGAGEYTVREPANGWQTYVEDQYYFLVRSSVPVVRWAGVRIDYEYPYPDGVPGTDGWFYWQGPLTVPQPPGSSTREVYYDLARSRDFASLGGAGGDGGLGAGFSQPLTPGAAGAAGGQNAGTGGAGGSGGGFGEDGVVGGTGANGSVSNGQPGSPGGLAGAYLRGAENAIFNNYGTALGRVI